LQPKPPGLFVHNVIGAQPPLFVAHSLMSVQVVLPEPTYPDGQGPQLRLPWVLVQTAMGAQPPLLEAHSFTSMQAVSPEPE
jgi:hypothetical protein